MLNRVKVVQPSLHFLNTYQYSNTMFCGTAQLQRTVLQNRVEARKVQTQRLNIKSMEYNVKQSSYVQLASVSRLTFAHKRHDV